MRGNEGSFAMVGMRVVRGPGWKWGEQVKLPFKCLEVYVLYIYIYIYIYIIVPVFYLHITQHKIFTILFRNCLSFNEILDLVAYLS